MLSPFELIVADEIMDQLIDLYARRAEASAHKDWEYVRRLDIEMARTSILREVMRDQTGQFELT